MSINSKIRLTPFLKWAGGKRWFVANHAAIFPSNYGRYIEPFLGSGAVYFYLKPRRALLSDLNRELIDTYCAIRDDWQQVEKRLVACQKQHSESFYYQVRSQSPLDRFDAASRFIYLNRTCWNGLYRVNKKGVFNVPKGTKDSVLLETDDFEAMARRLRTASLKCADFESSINAAERADLVFVDPPYTVKHNLNGFLKYNDRIFSWDDQVRLRDALFRAKRRGVQIIMTNANHKSLRDLYAGFELSALSRQSVLSGDVRGRCETEELLVTNI
jgi:DNA adenine methylase